MSLDALLQPMKDALEGKIDFEGQKLSERVGQVGLAITTVISFLVGWVMSSTFLSVAVFGAGLVVVLLATIPPWPVYNSHPTTFLPIRTSKSEKSE